MNIDEIFDHVLLRSGQFIMSKNKVELDKDRFRLIVDEALAQYSKFSPVERRLFVTVEANRTYTFTEANTSGDGPPEMLSSVTPIRVLGINPWALRQIYGIPTSDGNLDIRQECPWEYRKPKLTLPYPGEYDILGIYNHRTVTMNKDDGTQTYDAPSITLRDHDVIDLIRGMFLEGIGRSRRSFTLTDLPIVMDADTIAGEGRELIEKATTNMQVTSKFYLAYGG